MTTNKQQHQTLLLKGSPEYLMPIERKRYAAAARMYEKVANNQQRSFYAKA